MKRIIALLLAVMTVFTLAACGTKDTTVNAQGLAQALLGDPDILILDEPTAGLDPLQITEIRTLIRRLSSEHTIILSSHILSEVSAVCDEVLIKKRDLTARLNAHTDKEEWVQCGSCQRWYHSVCVLYNGKICRQGKKLVFHCPLCIQDLKETLECPNRQLFLPRADGGWCAALSVMFSCDVMSDVM